ncbi:MAG: dihydrofolate reductase family protein [Tannerellaceae bacterium]|jgi:dihydrofolate reductase|nr:dihydrofolate reductase family protein [Tannerellaceae bacterium]
MKKIKLYVAISIDGYIARIDGDLDWMSGFPNLGKTDYGYQAFFELIDTVIMDESTYLNILSMDIIWPYKNKTVYVATPYPTDDNDKVHFIPEDAIETISKLREEEGKDIWLASGGKLLSMLLEHDMIDEMVINRYPLILGCGTPLLPDYTKESEWKVKDSITYKNGVTGTIYTR